MRKYGDSHPEAWVELRFEMQPTVRIVSLFAGDNVQGHARALRNLVGHPDQLEVRSSPWPLIHLEEIRAAIHELARITEPGKIRRWGIGGGKVNVGLAASQEHLAAELQDRYGEAIDLTVGFFHFPDMAILNHDGPPCPRTESEPPCSRPMRSRYRFRRSWWSDRVTTATACCECTTSVGGGPCYDQWPADCVHR